MKLETLTLIICLTFLGFMLWFGKDLFFGVGYN